MTWVELNVPKLKLGLGKKRKKKVLPNFFTYIFVLFFWSETYRAHYTTAIDRFLLFLKDLLPSRGLWHLFAFSSSWVSFPFISEISEKRNQITERVKKSEESQLEKGHVLLTVPPIKEGAFGRHLGCRLLFQKAQEGAGHSD